MHVIFKSVQMLSPRSIYVQVIKQCQWKWAKPKVWQADMRTTNKRQTWQTLYGLVTYLCTSICMTGSKNIKDGRKFYLLKQSGNSYINLLQKNCTRFYSGPWNVCYIYILLFRYLTTLTLILFKKLCRMMVI